jgi:hypothetical protein
MKWVWIVLGSLAAIVALIAVTGWLLPVKHVSTRRARYRQTPEAIWPSISPGSFQHRFRQDDVNYEVLETVPHQRLVTKIADTNLPYGGGWTYEIEPEANGCILRITERGEVYNPIFRFVSRFVIGHTASLDKALREIGAKFGDQVTIED